MLNALGFTKNKLCQRCNDNNLQKILRANTVENGTGQILLIVVLIVDLWFKLLSHKSEISPSLILIIQGKTISSSRRKDCIS